MLPDDGTSMRLDANTAPRRSWSVMRGQPFSVHDPAVDFVRVTLALYAPEKSLALHAVLASVVVVAAVVLVVVLVVVVVVPIPWRPMV